MFKPDKTVSAHAYNWKLNNLLFRNKAHCKESYMSKFKREHMPKEYQSFPDGDG
jgi:hypothetical protein